MASQDIWYIYNHCRSWYVIKIVLYIITGFFAGVIGGMGIGGGSVLIPSLTYFFDIAQKQAQSTNLISFIPTAIAALVVHIKNKRVLYKTAFWIIGFGVVGAIGGGLLSTFSPQDILRKIFAVFMCFIGIYELIIASKNKNL